MFCQLFFKLLLLKNLLACKNNYQIRPSLKIRSKKSFQKQQVFTFTYVCQKVELFVFHHKKKTNISINKNRFPIFKTSFAHSVLHFGLLPSLKMCATILKITHKKDVNLVIRIFHFQGLFFCLTSCIPLYVSLNSAPS